MSSRRTITPKDIQIVRMRAYGMTWPAIADSLGYKDHNELRVKYKKIIEEMAESHSREEAYAEALAAIDHQLQRLNSEYDGADEPEALKDRIRIIEVLQRLLGDKRKLQKVDADISVQDLLNLANQMEANIGLPLSTLEQHQEDDND